MKRGYPQPNSVDVLFVTYGGGHVQAVLPVAQALHEQGVKVCVFALTTAISAVSKTDVPFFSYADLPRSKQNEVQAIGQRLAADMPSNGVLPYEETVAYLGVNYADMELQHGAEQAAHLWDNGGRQHFSPLPTMIDIISDIAPKIVMATNSPRSEQAAISAASQLGVTGLCLVDLFALHAVSWLSKPSFGKQLFVLNEAVKEMFVENGRPEIDVVVTGNPAFDGIFDPVVVAAGAEMHRTRQWGDEGRLTVLYASSPEPEKHPFTGVAANPALPRAIEDHLRLLVAQDERLELIVRRHPSEDQDIKLGNRIHASPRADDINALVHAVDLVIVTCSTVGLQAYLAGTPVISLECSVFSPDAPYGEFGMSTSVEDIHGLHDAIAQFEPKNPNTVVVPKDTALEKVTLAVKAHLNERA